MIFGRESQFSMDGIRVLYVIPRESTYVKQNL